MLNKAVFQIPPQNWITLSSDCRLPQIIENMKKNNNIVFYYINCVILEASLTLKICLDLNCLFVKIFSTKLIIYSYPKSVA